MRPWIFTIDNILVDKMIQHPSEAFLNDHGVKPGLQFTATTPELMQVALKMLKMENGDLYGSTNVATCLGGCSVNTSRASEIFFKSAQNGPYPNRVATLGSIG